MAIRKGIEAVDEGGRSGGGANGRFGYFNLKKDGDSIVVRFITDLDKDVITLDFWEFIVDNKGGPQNFAVAADVFDNPNQKDYVLEYGGQQKAFGTNDLSDPTPKTRSVGLAVVCKEVATEGANGKTKITYVPEEIDIETKKGVFKGYQFLIVKQAYKNFWGPLKTHWEENGKTICDRYYKIKRIGTGNDTTYSFMEKTPDLEWEDNPVESYAALKAQFGYGEAVSMDDEDRFKKAPQTLEEWAEESCSEQRVKFFLGSLEEREAQNSGGTPSAAAADSEDEAAPAPASNLGLAARMSRHQEKADA